MERQVTHESGYLYLPFFSIYRSRGYMERKFDLPTFVKAVSNSGIDMTKEEVEAIFKQMDVSGM